MQSSLRVSCDLSMNYDDSSVSVCTVCPIQNKQVMCCVIDSRLNNRCLSVFQSGRIGADEAINNEEGDAEVLDELIKEKEAKTKAILLEMVDFTTRTRSFTHTDAVRRLNVCFLLKGGRSARRRGQASRERAVCV